MRLASCSPLFLWGKVEVEVVWWDTDGWEDSRWFLVVAQDCGRKLVVTVWLANVQQSEWRDGMECSGQECGCCSMCLALEEAGRGGWYSSRGGAVGQIVAVTETISKCNSTAGD